MQNFGVKSSVLLKTVWVGIIRIPMRTKYKKTWAVYKKKKTTSEHALSYFDVYHKQVYDKLWPSMRIALLSAQKYGALLNNYSADSDTVQRLMEETGAQDIISIARDRHLEILMKPEDENIEVAEVSTSTTTSTEDEGKEDAEPTLVDNENIHEFIPPKRVYTDDELYAMEQYQLSIYKHRDLQIPKIVESELILPNQLKMFCHDKDVVTGFPAPKGDGLGKLGYYLQDAASILPVLALDVRPNERILDLCAAPGGKSLAFLQTLLPYIVVANDNSDGRLKRLINVAKSYLPDLPLKERNMILSRQDGKSYLSNEEFDGVLVDVPCLTDRHVLNTDENNIFKPARVNERITLPQTQSALLISGMNNVRVDGNVVYSTCTLANAQNDGVVEVSLDHFHEKTDKQFAIVDISVLKQLFHDVFFFYDNTRHGLLVVPNVRANFGPTYVCKIKRLS